MMMQKLFDFHASLQMYNLLYRYFLPRWKWTQFKINVHAEIMQATPVYILVTFKIYITLKKNNFVGITKSVIP